MDTSLEQSLENAFSNLDPDEYRITSTATMDYNCIAWAAEDVSAWWWPDAFGQYCWPPKSPRIETVEAFVAAYGILGYLPCTDACLEQGFEKIAVYVDARGKPTHAARQLPSGQWTSKLGLWEDIEHNTIDGLSGDTYGKVGHILRRPVPADNPTSKAI